MDAVPPPLMHEVIDPLRAKDHAVFGGKLDRTHLYIGDRAVAQALNVADGDYRDWEAIRAWAAKIATELGLIDPGAEI